MKLSNRNIFALLAASASLLTSCSDDVLFSDEKKESEGRGVILYLPEVPEDATPVEGTRGDGQLIGFTRSETTFQNRRLFVYEVDAEGKIADNQEPIDLDIKGKTPNSSRDGYAAYQLEIPTGNYKMYVTANIGFADDTDANKKITFGELKSTKVTVPANLDNGLPMSCPNEELEVKYGTNGTTSQVGNDYISIAPGAEDVTIMAKMKYTCAKVRVTTINDVRPQELIGDISVSGLLTNSSLFSGEYYEMRNTKDKEAPFKATAPYPVPDAAKKYYNKVNISPDGIGKSDVEPSKLGTVFNPTTGNTTPYTHQAVFYVPERLFQDGDNTDATLNLTIGGNSKPIYLGATENGGTVKVLRRSKFYDYVGAPDGKFYLQVQNWEPETMVGSLNGNVWLEVDKTAISVAAGFTTQINYKTNASDITPECAYYPNKKDGVPIYDLKWDKKTGILSVALNKDIDRAEFNAIKAGSDWKYITITAGTIVKKIEVANFDFNEYIMDDTMVTIDVNERKQSGRYSSSIPVSLNTNVQYISFEKVDWPTAAESGTPASLILQDKDGNAIATNTSIKVPDNGVIDFQIAFNELNSDRELWKNDHDMNVVVYALDKDGNKITNNGQQVKATVGVHVRTSYDVYRIHFKGDGWIHPHIFVYQCLKLPGDLVANTGAKPNQVVGHNKDYAALEYDFTGAVAFQGWYVGSYNNPTAPGNTDNYFWIFNDGTSWDPSNSNDFDKHYTRLDFAKAHRDKLRTGNNGDTYCNECTKNDFGMNWPGIHMLPDTDNPGWWYFELTGVADPGKALIMFTDLPRQQWEGHKYDNNVDENKRYPKKEQPGVALFDYPTKEGWFEYKTSGTLTFQSEKPGTSTGGGSGDTHPQTTSTFEVGTTYAILFNKATTVWFYTTNDSNNDVEKYSAETLSQGWPGANYNKVFTFTPTKAGATKANVMYDGNNSNNHNTHVSLFKWNSATQRYEATINP